MKVLLHICCGVCAAGASEQLLIEGHRLTGFFFNPNLYPPEEYSMRLRAAAKISKINDFELIIPSNDPKGWNIATSNLANEPERGQRCEVCFRIRLQTTFEYMRKHDFDSFTTSLTIGPQKSAESINRIGTEIGGKQFLIRDFKKCGGYQRAVQLSRQHNIYRQNYCGCAYSIRNNIETTSSPEQT